MKHHPLWMRTRRVLPLLNVILILILSTQAFAQDNSSPDSGNRVFLPNINGNSSTSLAAPNAGAVNAAAILPTLPPSTQFDITGFPQDATLDTACVTAAGTSLDGLGFPKVAHCGGTITLNGHKIVVPAETIVILPASALTWQELFAQAPGSYAPTKSGVALSDSPAPLTTYEFQVVGNRVGNTYIAGLVHASQQDLNGGSGYINYMDYATGEMRVGGVLGDPNSGARVRINDPANATSVNNSGRYGRAMSPDKRFMVDQDNPTIAAATGFPMCFPRVAPSGVAGVETDPQCPQGNRPLSTGVNDVLGQHPPAGEFDTLFRMNDPAALPLGGALDPRLQAPFEVGDFVTFAGTLVTTDPNHPTDGPYPGTSSTYISAHTIIDDVGIYTAPGTNPAYVSIEVGLIGTGGLTIFGAGEAAIRTRFEGMATDETRAIHLYGIDFSPVDGSTSDRDWGTILPDPGPPNGAVRGRWRYRPPCTATVATDKKCVGPAGGSFLPAPREFRAVIEGLQTQVPGTLTAVTAANGIFYGQYHAPIGEYIFPENIPGNPIPENNFNTIPFLAQGGYASVSGVVAGQLKPWPSNILPAGSCVAPVANAGGPYTVASGGTVTLAGSASGTSPAFTWASPAQGTLSALNIANPVYAAPLVAADTVVNLSLTAANSCGSSTANATVTVNGQLTPTVNPVAPITVFSGANGSFTVTGSDPNVPAATPLLFSVAQNPAGTLLNVVVTQVSATSAQVTFTAPTLAPGQTQLVVNLSITAQNSLGVSSAATAATVTVKPIADVVTITNAEFRTGKQRLDLTATSSVVSPNVFLTLQPYRCETASTLCPGGTFDPATLGASFTNTGGGLYTITLVGAPPPACKLGGTYTTPCSQRPLTVASNLGGLSPTKALDRIRQ